MHQNALALVATCFFCAALSERAAADPVGSAGQQVPVTSPVEVVSPYRLGVNGGNTNLGYQVSYAYPGTRARSLWSGPVRYTLEPGDYITKVNGVRICKTYTLQEALARSNGVVSLTVFDGRNCRYLNFRDVVLDTAP